MFVQYFKLNNGEEFIAELLSKGDGLVKFKNPVVAVVENQNSPVLFYPWAAWTKHREFELAEDSFTFILDALDAVAKEYESAFNDSKIITPAAKQIIT